MYLFDSHSDKALYFLTLTLEESIIRLLIPEPIEKQFSMVYVYGGP